MNTMSIEEIVKLLDAEVNKVYEEYISSHRALMPYSEKELDQNEVSEANVILKDIQEGFNKIWPAFHWIKARHDLATNAADEYNKFIERLIANGAKQSGFEEEPTIITPPETAQG